MSGIDEPRRGFQVDGRNRSHRRRPMTDHFPSRAPRTHWSRSPRRALVLALSASVASVLGTGACSDGPAEPETPSGHLSFLVQPEDVAAGRAFTAAPVVRLEDENGAPLSLEGEVTLRLEGNPAGAVLAGQTSRAGRATIASFTGVSVDRPGSYRLVAEWRGQTESSLDFDVVPAPDVIRIHNAGTEARGIVIDGATSRGFVNDDTLLTADTIIEVVRKSQGANGEVVVFDRQRAVTAVPTPWTSGVDTFDITLRDRLKIPITIWMMSTRPERVQNAVDEWLAAWHSEGIGIDVDLEMVDLTGIPGAAQVDGWGFCRADSDERKTWGYRPDRINVYYVEFEGTGGVNCGPKREVAMIINRLGNVGALLSHELGHSFGLPHYFDLDLAGFADTGNAMGGGLSYYTEGQIFDIHYGRASSLVRVYGFDPGVRDCYPPRDEEDDRPWCLPHAFRFWPDGTPAG